MTFQELYDDESPAAEYLDELGATYEAVMRGTCAHCGAAWMPESIGGLWAVILEHEDTCPQEVEAGR